MMSQNAFPNVLYIVGVPIVLAGSRLSDTHYWLG